MTILDIADEYGLQRLAREQDQLCVQCETTLQGSFPARAIVRGMPGGDAAMCGPCAFNRQEAGFDVVWIDEPTTDLLYHWHHIGLIPDLSPRSSLLNQDKYVFSEETHGDIDGQTCHGILVLTVDEVYACPDCGAHFDRAGKLEGHSSFFVDEPVTEWALPKEARST